MKKITETEYLFTPKEYTTYLIQEMKLDKQSAKLLVSTLCSKVNTKNGKLKISIFEKKEYKRT